MSTPAAQPLDVALAHVADFPERLGPVLVKELRQGLRSGLFILPFVVLPAVLALVALWALSIDNVREARSGVAAFFWGAVLVPVLVITPLRALGAIRAERDAQTLELLQLTPLTAWRIVFAKWSSLMVQALLWVAALLPFLVLRYFFGGMDLAGEALFLFWMLLGSGSLTALALVVSTLPRLVSWLALAAMLILGLWSLGVLVIGRALGGSRSTMFWSSASPWLTVINTLASAHVIYLTLAFASSRIAPLADNYASRLRLAAVGLFAWFGLAAIPQLGLMPEAHWFFFVAALACCTLLTLVEMTSARTPLQTHVQAWMRLGPPGLWIGRAFQPGWPSTVIFYSGVLALVAIIVALSAEEKAEPAIVGALLWTAVMFPRALQCFFATSHAERPGLHLILHLLGPVIAATLAAFSFVLGAGLFVSAALFPPALIWLVGFEGVKLEDNQQILGVIGGIWVLGLLAIFARHWRGYWRQFAELAARGPVSAASSRATDPSRS